MERDAMHRRERRASIDSELVMCLCGLQFLPHVLAKHQRACEACRPQKKEADADVAPSWAGQRRRRHSIEFADNGANTFVPCSWCGRTFFPDRLQVHLRVCKSKQANDVHDNGCRPTMTELDGPLSVGRYAR